VSAGLLETGECTQLYPCMVMLHYQSPYVVIVNYDLTLREKAAPPST